MPVEGERRERDRLPSRCYRPVPVCRQHRSVPPAASRQRLWGELHPTTEQVRFPERRWPCTPPRLDRLYQLQSHATVPPATVPGGSAARRSPSRYRAVVLRCQRRPLARFTAWGGAPARLGSVPPGGGRFPPFRTSPTMQGLRTAPGESYIPDQKVRGKLWDTAPRTRVEPHEVISPVPARFAGPSRLNVTDDCPSGERHTRQQPPAALPAWPRPAR